MERVKQKQDKLYLYNRYIADAKLDGIAKGLLYFYANVYNWSENRASYWSQRSICASVGISQNTYQKKRKYLEQLGWIKVQYRGRNTPCLVHVNVGLDDPEYDKRSWAQGHRRVFMESELAAILTSASNKGPSTTVDLIGSATDLRQYSTYTGTTNISTE